MNGGSTLRIIYRKQGDWMGGLVMDYPYRTTSPGMIVTSSRAEKIPSRNFRNQAADGSISVLNATWINGALKLVW